MVFKKGHIPWSTGLTKETDPRIRRIAMLSAERTLSEEAKKKISEKAKERYKDPTKNPMYGRKHSEETKRKISEIRKQRVATGQIIPWSRGRKFSESHKQRMSESTKRLWNDPDYREWMQKINSGKNNPMYGVRGKKHHNWKGGVSFEDYPPEFNNDLKQRIRTRDNNHCHFPSCKENQDLTTHHIDYDKKNNEEVNLITLCRTHNATVNYNRVYWEGFFNKTIKEIYR